MPDSDISSNHDKIYADDIIDNDYGCSRYSLSHRSSHRSLSLQRLGPHRPPFFEIFLEHSTAVRLLWSLLTRNVGASDPTVVF